MTSIEWTDRTWNPTVGCSRVSPGCEHCYAETMAARNVLMSRGQGRESVYLPVVDAQRRRWTRKVELLPERLEQPLTWRKPSRIFVDSMSDLFHKDIPLEFIAATYGAMAIARRHTYQVLTKREERAPEFYRWVAAQAKEAGLTPAAVCVGEFLRHVVLPGGDAAQRKRAAELVFLGQVAATSPWPLPNVHLGVSVEDQQRADERIPLLLECPAALRFLSVEPLLGRVDLTAAFSVCDAHGEPSGPRCNPDGSPAIGWAIVGGESGPGARDCEVAWIRGVVGQCKEAGVPVFVKQLGARPVETRPVTATFGNNLCGELGAMTMTAHCRRALALKSRKGNDPGEWPEDLRVQEMPHPGPREGDRVRYWTGVREGPGKVGVARTGPCVLGGHTEGIYIHGAGFVAMSHVVKADEGGAPCA